MTDSPIFIVSCPRSGTALLRDLLRSHPHITIPGESHFIPKLYRAYGNPVNGREACRLASIILNLHLIKSWGLELDLSSFVRYRSHAQVVSRIFEEWAKKENKPRWGDKTPQYVSEIPTLLELFPSCKIIHIYRDGRDVALSWIRTAFGPENIFTAAHQWEYHVNAGRQVGITLSPEIYLEVRYETLLSYPEATMKRICSFLNEPFCNDVLKPNFLERQNHLAIMGKHENICVSKTKIVSSNSGKWKEAMSHSNQILFESVAGDLLKTLGYETEGLTRCISPLEQFMWKIHHLFLFILNRLNTKRKKSWVSSHFLMRWATIRYYLKSAELFSRFLRR